MEAQTIVKASKSFSNFNIILSVSMFLVAALTVYNTVMIQLQSNMNESYQLEADEQRVKRDLPTNDDNERELPVHAHHWRAKFRVLERHILNQHNNPLSVHLMSRDRNSTSYAPNGQSATTTSKPVTPRAYMNWTYSTVGNPDNTTRPHLDSNYNSVIIPANGTYYVYTQITWTPPSSNQIGQLPKNNVYEVVTLNGDGDETTLITSITSYSNNTASGLGDKPINSGFSSGVFYLREGAIIAVKTLKIFNFNTQYHQTYMGLYLLAKPLPYLSDAAL